jgi:hypothetical protein
VPAAPDRVLLIGMGSSRYAAQVAALRLRAAGIDAVAEYASAEASYPAEPGPHHVPTWPACRYRAAQQAGFAPQNGLLCSSVTRGRRLAALRSPFRHTSVPAVYELFGDKAGLVREIFFEGFRRLGAQCSGRAGPTSGT